MSEPLEAKRGTHFFPLYSSKHPLKNIELLFHNQSFICFLISNRKCLVLVFFACLTLQSVDYCWLSIFKESKKEKKRCILNLSKVSCALNLRGKLFSQLKLGIFYLQNKNLPFLKIKITCVLSKYFNDNRIKKLPSLKIKHFFILVLFWLIICS